MKELRMNWKIFRKSDSRSKTDQYQGKNLTLQKKYQSQIVSQETSTNPKLHMFLNCSKAEQRNYRNRILTLTVCLICARHCAKQFTCVCMCVYTMFKQAYKFTEGD